MKHWRHGAGLVALLAGLGLNQIAGGAEMHVLQCAFDGDTTDRAGTKSVKAEEVRFGPGVTILEGPNEIGKSSLAEAVRLLFEYKDSSRHRDVQATAPVHRDAGPEVGARRAED